MDAAPRGVWWYRFAILLAPVLVLWRQDNPLFTPPGTVDSWLYLGYFRDLVNFKRDLFPNLYYGSRLPMLLPGYAVHAILPPVAASAVLHLALLFTASLALFEALRQLAGRRAAFLTVLLFCGNPQVWYAIGWDYFDGFVIAYCLVTLAALTHAAAGRGGWRAPVLAGAGIAGIVYSNLICVVFVPVLGLYYAGIAWVWRRPLRDAWRAPIVCAATVAAVTAALCLVNRVIDGAWWFYAPSVHTGQILKHQNRWETSPWRLYGLAPWLWLTTGAVIAAIVRVVRGSLRDVAAMVSFALIIPFAIYCYFQPVLWAALGQPYYAALLLPFVFLAIGALFFSGIEAIGARRFAVYCGLAAAGIATVWGDYASAWTPLWPHAIPLVVMVGGGLLALALMPGMRAWGILCGIGGIVLFASETRYLPRGQSTSRDQGVQIREPHENRAMLERVMANRGWIEDARRGHAVRFWFDSHEPASDDFVPLNATYLYQYSRWPAPDRGPLCLQAPAPGNLLIALGAGDAAEQARRAFESCSAGQGLVVRTAGVRTTHHPDGRYNMTLFSIEHDPLRWRVANVVGEALETRAYVEPWPAWGETGWRLLEQQLGTHMQYVDNTWRLTTPANRYARAALYGPLIASEAGTYTFTMSYTAESEQFAFGVRSSDGGWLVTDTVGQRAGLQRERTCTVKLAAGQQIRVEIANNRDHEEPTKVEIRGIRSAVLLDAR
jgi:hypothetical protein